MYLRAITIHPKSERESAGWNRLCGNVSFIVTQALKPLKIDIHGVSTVVVRFADEDRSWDQVVRLGIAEVMVDFDPAELDRSRPVESQEAILRSLLRGVRKLSGPHRLDEVQLAAIEASVVDASFSIEIPLTSSVAVKTSEGQLRVQAVMRTHFDHCAVLLCLTLKRRKTDLKVFETLGSPRLTYRSVQKLSLQSNHALVLTCAWSGDEPVDEAVFDRTFYDLSSAPVSAQVLTVKDEIRFRYSIKELGSHASLTD